MASAAPQIESLLMMLAGWINRQQLELIAYILEESRLLKERWDPSAFGLPMPSGDDSRARLISWAARSSVGPIRWLRRIPYCADIAIWSHENVATTGGAAPVAPYVANDRRADCTQGGENPSWGYTRI
jgi:hypothetical protein